VRRRYKCERCGGVFERIRVPPDYVPAATAKVEQDGKKFNCEEYTVHGALRNDVVKFVDHFFIWMIGKPVPLWCEIVMTVTFVAAMIHYYHLTKWFIEWWKEQDEAD
jgi:hypothetical protein